MWKNISGPVAHDLHGRGTPEARTWVEPLLQQVREDQTASVIANLAELKPRLQAAQQEKLQTQPRAQLIPSQAPKLKQANTPPTEK